MSERETLARQYAWTHGDSQTREDFLAGWDAALAAGFAPAHETAEWEYGVADRDGYVWPPFAGTPTHRRSPAVEAGPWLPIPQPAHKAGGDFPCCMDTSCPDHGLAAPQPKEDNTNA